MSKVFGKFSGPDPKVPRNTFDLSYFNNLSLNVGHIVPFCCKEVLPNDSCKIDTSLSFRTFPFLFPVQTRVRCDVHWFYVRNRNLWSDWMNFYGDLDKSLVMPYLSNVTSKTAGVSSLADYLGVPVTLSGSYGSIKHNVPSSLVSRPTSSTLPNGFLLSAPCGFWTGENDGSPTSTAVYFDQLFKYTEEFGKDFKVLQFPGSGLSGDEPNYGVNDGRCLLFPIQLIPDSASIKLLKSNGSISINLTFNSFSHVSGRVPYAVCYSPSKHDSSGTSWDIRNLELGYTDATDGVIRVPFNIPEDATYSGDFIFIVLPCGSATVNNQNYSGVPPAILRAPVVPSQPVPAASFEVGFGGSSTQPIFKDSSLIPNPFVPDSKGNIPIPLNALPFRAYESIYNAFYRDERNNPYVLDGKTVYNKYLPTTDGGADSNVYELRRRNWEQDFITTAVPSPQQGNAPLVGITSSGVATFADPETGQNYEVQLESADGDHVDGVSYREALPNSVSRSLVDVVTSGISINDFRNVNAFQRWLETNMRKGFKYRDMIAGHFGVTPSYAELDMPEFIGGFSSFMNVNQVTQTSEGSSDSPLGSFAGQGFIQGSSKHPIRRTFDEHGYLIGVVSIVPVPNYSQLLPKHFIKRDLLDYYSKEFGHIGMQPITYNEVCPVQSYRDDPNSLNDVYGYQRAWYDYLASTDEVHGEFRTSMRDFLINRVFDTKPTLSPSFLTVNPDSINNIFAVNDTSDKIFGVIAVGLSMKRPIPRYGIPKLEA